MRPLAFLLGAVLILLGNTSCLRNSTVVKVKKDGSGSIVSRYHFSPQMMAMLGQIEALGGAFGGLDAAGADGGPNLGLLKDLAKPDEESLRADAAGYGEGVRYAKHEAGPDEDGWTGYSVVYEFDDIRRVRIDQNSVPGKAKDFVKSAGEEIKPGEGGGITFALEGDVLTVTTSFAEKGFDGVLDPKQIEQAKQAGMAPSEMMKMSAGMTQGMRVGHFIRAEGGIAETDASHAEGDLITISDVDVSKMMSDPDFAAFVDKAAADPKSVTRESTRELAGKIEAMTVETKETFTVKLK